MKPYGIVSPLFEQQGGGSELEACATLQIIQEEIARLPQGPVVIDLFGLRRPPKSAWREAYAAQWIAAVPQPVSLRLPLPAPPVVPPVTPTKPVDRDRAQIAGGIAAIAGAVIGLWRWLRRKKK